MLLLVRCGTNLVVGQQLVVQLAGPETESYSETKAKTSQNSENLVFHAQD